MNGEHFKIRSINREAKRRKRKEEGERERERKRRDSSRSRVVDMHTFISAPPPPHSENSYYSPIRSYKRVSPKAQLHHR